MYSHILKINSRESNYRAYTTNPIQISYNNMSNSSLIQKIVVKGASVPNVFYNVTSNKNTLVFTKNAVVYTIIFPVGNYTVSSFITAFNSSAQGIASGVSLAFDTFLNKITVTSPTHITTFDGTLSTCFHIIGLRQGDNFSVPIATVTTLLFMPDFSGIRNIYAETTFSNMNCLDSSGYKSYGAFIPCDQPFGSIIHYINTEQDLNDVYRSKMYSQNMSKIEIALRDVEGGLLDLQNMNWEITFKIMLSHDHDLLDE